MTITFTPTKKTVNTRTRGVRTIINDPVDGVSSVTFIFETIEYTDSGEVLRHIDSVETYVINAPSTPEEANAPQTIFGVDGKPITEPIIINPSMTKVELWRTIKLLINSGLLNDLQAKEALDE